MLGWLWAGVGVGVGWFICSVCLSCLLSFGSSSSVWSSLPAQGLRNGSLCLLPSSQHVLRYHVFPMECSRKLVRWPRVELRLVQNSAQAAHNVLVTMQAGSKAGGAKGPPPPRGLLGKLLFDPADIGSLFVYPKARSKKDFAAKQAGAS